MKLKSLILIVSSFFSMLMFLPSCFLGGGSGQQGVGSKSSSTGWEYNYEDMGRFEVQPYIEQEAGPGLVLVEGGTFIMGRTAQDVISDWNNMPRRVTVASFYMDETEVRTVDY